MRLWVSGHQPETHSLPDDALGRAIQAAWIGMKVPSPAMSTVPILGPRVDLLKHCIFTTSVFQLAACAEDEGTRQRGFWIGVCSLVTPFMPGPFLFCDGASRMLVAKACSHRRRTGTGAGCPRAGNSQPQCCWYSY